MKCPAVSVVIPVHNEEDCLSDSLGAIRDVMIATNERFELLVVDDGSTDGTWNVILDLHHRWPELKGLRLSRNFGKENAICAGLSEAAGDGVIIMDADLQHPPGLIPGMIREWRNGADVVEAVKRDRGQESWFSRMSARLFYSLMSGLTQFDWAGASDFKLLDRKVVNAWKMLGERNVFFRGMAAWVGYTRKQLPFDVAPRVSGRSKWSRWRLAGLAIRAITSFSSVPLRIIGVAGLIFLAFAMMLGLHTLYQYFSGEAVTGFATVILLILLTSSLIMLALGIIGEYLARIYEEVKGRPRYLIRDRLE
ncbi:MAG: glycosyltransferase [Anaerolineae bacterium]|nr:MAG: glycosyltransferase [Anaerolineae bacterium]